MSGWDVWWGFAPILLLIALTFRGYATTTTLPVATLALYMVSLIYFKFEPNFVNAFVVKGLGDSLTTIAIVFGAICLFESLKMTKALDWLTDTLKSFSRGNATAEVMLLAWAFAYLIEGCSGFGTPTALAAPLLVDLGYDAEKTVICCLIMNTLATPFGAAGTPIWFGLDGLGLDDDSLTTVGFWSQAVASSAANVIPLFAAAQLVGFADLREEWKTVFVCVYACSGVALAVSAFSYELPTLLGGGIGLVASAFYVKSTNTPPREMLREVSSSLRSATSSIRSATSSLRASSRRFVRFNGRSRSSRDDDQGVAFQKTTTETTTPGDDDAEEARPQDDDLPAETKDDVIIDVETARDETPPLEKQQPTWKYVMPLGLVVFYLTLTRFPELDLKDELKSQKPRATVRLGSFGEFWVSSAVVLGLTDIFREPSVTTTFEVLYVPAVFPFLAVSVLALCVFGQARQVPTLLRRTWKRTSAVVLPVASALVLAALMRAGVAAKIARPLITSLGRVGWIFVAPLFGCLGSFFSGSTTVSNLTFGSVHVLAADRLGLNKLHLLALQTVGATVGNCVCLQNIIQAKAVVGLDTLESEFIKHTYKPAALFVVFAWAWGLLLLLLD